MGPAIFFRCLSAFFSSSPIDLNFSRGVPTRNTQNPQVGNRHVADPQHWFETGNKHDDLVVLSPWSFSLANSRNRRPKTDLRSRAKRVRRYCCGMQQTPDKVESWLVRLVVVVVLGLLACRPHFTFEFVFCQSCGFLFEFDCISPPPFLGKEKRLWQASWAIRIGPILVVVVGFG